MMHQSRNSSRLVTCQRARRMLQHRTLWVNRPLQQMQCSITRQSSLLSAKTSAFEVPNVSAVYATDQFSPAPRIRLFKERASHISHYQNRLTTVQSTHSQAQCHERGAKRTELITCSQNQIPKHPPAEEATHCHLHDSPPWPCCLWRQAILAEAH